MKVVFDWFAKAELDDAKEYYDLEVPRLGNRFKTEVKLGIKRIREHPEAWQKENGEIRRYVLHRFPY